MSRRTHKTNAFQSQLANPITAGQTSFDLSSTTGLEAPGYGTLDHDNIALTEWVRYEGIAGTTLTGVTRGLPGASGTGTALAHGVNAVFRQTYTAQDQDDIFSDIEDLEVAIAGHELAADPHSGYTTDAELAATNAVVATHTVDIAALEAADVILGADIDNLELADTAHFGSVTGHPAATETTDGFITAADLTKLRRIGTHCVATTSVVQNYSVGNFHYVVFDVDNYDPAGIHSPNSSLFILPFTGIWQARFRNQAQTVMNRAVFLRVGATPGTGTAIIMAEGRDLGPAQGDHGQNLWVSGPFRLTEGTQLHVELGDQDDENNTPNETVAAGSALTLAYFGDV